ERSIEVFPEPPQGFEPWTSALRKRRSTAELRRQWTAAQLAACHCLDPILPTPVHADYGRIRHVRRRPCPLRRRLLYPPHLAKERGGPNGQDHSAAYPCADVGR